MMTEGSGEETLERGSVTQGALARHLTALLHSLPSRGRDGAYRVAWLVLSLLVTFGCGVLTGMKAVEHMTAAPLVRAGILLAGSMLLAAAAAWITRELARIRQYRQRVDGALLRGKAFGPPRRWGIWVASLWIACAVSYLLTEHGEAASELAALLPAHAVEIPVLLVCSGIVAPYLHDLLVGGRTRRWPWSRSVQDGVTPREHDDVVGAISRMSPPLLFALLLGLGMFLATYIVGIHQPMRMLGGFGILGFAVTGLFTAPSLLRESTLSFEMAWSEHWYERQRDVVGRLRPLTVHARQLAVTVQVLCLGVSVGAVLSGSVRAADTFSGLGIIALLAMIVGAVMTELLLRWAPQLADEPAIGTEVIEKNQRMMLRIAGVALVAGSVCSIAYVLFV